MCSHLIAFLPDSSKGRATPSGKASRTPRGSHSRRGPGSCCRAIAEKAGLRASQENGLQAEVWIKDLHGQAQFCLSWRPALFQHSSGKDQSLKCDLK